MRRLLALAALPLALAACAAPRETVWFAPGTPSLEAEQAFLGCAAEARRDFPERYRIATAPRITLGGGFCRGRGCIGLDTAPEVFDTDANAALRARSVDACMQAKGYRETVLPGCPAGPVTVLQSQPFDTRGLCVANGRIATR